MFPKRKIHIAFIMVLLIIPFSYCSTVFFDIDIPDHQTPKIPDTLERHLLIYRNTNKVIGRAELRIKHYLTEKRLFYKVSSLFIMDLVYHDNEERIKINMKHTAIVDRSFKLRSFNGVLIYNGKKSVRKGHFKPPYFYIVENKKEFRIQAPKGIFSTLLKRYLVGHKLRRPGDGAIYRFFNLVSLKKEEERFFYEKRKNIELNKQKVFTKIFYLTNYTYKYRGIYWFNVKNQLLKKTDFNNSVLWRLDQKK